MSQILLKKALGTMRTSSGVNLALSAATKTTDWTRPDSAADAMKDPLMSAVLKNESVLPTGTKEVCTCEAAHPSPKDPRTHITAVCYDENGVAIQTVHLPTD
ncbi:hypothetical protein P154DRAFT_535547 [Amniculicola lignicola CBS 123094]|uniref:Uncharacterized protein n=1 Tax=Amniculicola lignicola CBS 123094 TaxID=1392246 RepID=A0A6A5WDX9_9PLEO|nr:hypothetical protein P154DRAFT_535547 [Amniculicola lignicola CBS 123094]